MGPEPRPEPASSLGRVTVRADRRPELMTGPRGVSDLVWDWSATRPLNAWPLVFEADAQVGGELLLIGGEPSEFCLEWAVEALDVVAEVHESTLVSQVKTGAEQAGRPDLYTEWRRFVT